MSKVKLAKHPLRSWMEAHPEFRAWRDSKRVFGVLPTFFYRVLKGEDRPSPERARGWEKITGISVEAFLFYNGKDRTR